MHCTSITASKQIVVCIAGFGDNSSMFDGLRKTSALDVIDFIPVDLPGFGTEALAETTLETLSEFVLKECRQLGTIP